MSAIANASKIPSQFVVSSGIFRDGPVTDYIRRYGMGGSDSSTTRFGGNAFVEGRAGLTGIASRFNGGFDDDGAPVTPQWESANGDSPLFDGIQDAFTFTFWKRLLPQSETKIIYKVNDPGVGGDGFEISLLASGILRFTSNGVNADSSISIDDGNYHFCVANFDGVNLNWYLDDELKGTTALTPNTFSTPGTGKVSIGSDHGLASFMAGDLDDLRIYSRSLPLSDGTEIFNYQVVYNPSQTTTISIHDPSQINTISKTVLDEVTEIDDIGTNADQPLKQTVLANSMFSGLATMGGLNALSSTTVDRFMENLMYPVPSSGNIALTFVSKIDGVSAFTAAALISMDATIDWVLDSANTTQFDGRIRTTSGGGSTNLTGGPFTGPDIWTIVFDFDNLIYTVFVNGVNVGSSSYTIILDPSQVFRIFTSRSSSQSVFGLFGEIVIREDVSDAQRELDEGIEAWKWFITTDLSVGNPALPIGHPFKKFPPPAIVPDGFDSGFSDGFE